MSVDDLPHGELGGEAILAVTKLAKLALIEYWRARYWKAQYERQKYCPTARPGGTYERSLHEACHAARAAFEAVAGDDAEP